MKDHQTNSRITLVLLWVTVLFNMIFADIFSIIVEIVNGDIIEIHLDVLTMMAIAGIITNIPILMVLLSWTLPYKLNRRVNIMASILTILYIIGGGILLPHYLVMGSVEVILLTIVIVTAIKWKPNYLKIE